jgi:hypothetical protein
MAGHVAAMRKDLAESNQRAGENMKRADEAEHREQETRQRGERGERWMLRMAAGALIFGGR